jgi:hypothetical protein
MQRPRAKTHTLFSRCVTGEEGDETDRRNEPRAFFAKIRNLDFEFSN